MKKIAVFLIILSLIILLGYFINIVSLKKESSEKINQYIEETSVIEDAIEEDTSIIVEQEKPKSNKIHYTAILEIPVINLKEGLVNVTKNFNSINYAISVDQKSNYPDQMGNFILYAHSGNSNIAFFKHLDKVSKDDDIYVYYSGMKYHYKIYDKYNIEKTGVTKINNSKNAKYITLITCNQKKKGYQIVVLGKLVNSMNY